MDRDELLKLREDIVAHARTLALEGGASPAERLDVIMGLVRSGDSSMELLNKAYEAAKELPEDADKLNAMLDIVYEIDSDLANNEGGSPDEVHQETEEAKSEQ